MVLTQRTVKLRPANCENASERCDIEDSIRALVISWEQSGTRERAGPGPAQNRSLYWKRQQTTSQQRTVDCWPEDVRDVFSEALWFLRARVNGLHCHRADPFRIGHESDGAYVADN